MRAAERNVGWLTLAALCLMAGPTAAEESPEPKDSALADRIREAVQQAGGKNLWGTVLVARGGEVLFVEGFGYADYDKRPNAPETLFEIASASKQVTAAAILRLEQQGKLETTDSIQRFFPAAPAAMKAVTIDHLLHHTAGLAPNLGVPYSWTGSRAQYLREMLAKPLVAEPGKAFAYSNVGYALLAAVVEEVTRGTFEEYVRKELFAPAGLLDSGFIGERRLIDSDRVSLRRPSDDQPDASAAKWFVGWGYRGMGAVVTTALDLLRWDRALRGNAVLGDAAKAKYYAPGLGGYACGWQVEQTARGTTKVSHSGGVRGFACQYARWLEEDVVVVVLSNGLSDVHGVAVAASDLLFPPVKIALELDVQPYELSRYGAFEAKEGLSFAATREGGSATLTLRHMSHPVAVVRGPRTAFLALAGSLEGALAQSKHPSPEEPAALEGGLYLRQVGVTAKKARVEEGLALTVLSSYRGQKEDGTRIDDPRTVFVVTTGRGWPLMVKMNPKAGKALLELLRKTLA